MKKIISKLVLLLLCFIFINDSYAFFSQREKKHDLYAFTNSFHTRKDYFKSNVFKPKLVHMYLFTIMKDNGYDIVPISKKVLKLMTNNIYYIFFENDNIYYNINNSIVRDKDQKDALIIVRVLSDKLIVLIPSLGNTITLNINENKTIPVPSLSVIDGKQGFININYLQSK
jgi:hypothetical protein